MSDYPPNPRTPPPGMQVPPPQDSRRGPHPERPRSPVVGIVAIAIFVLILMLGWIASQRDVMEAPAPVASPEVTTEPPAADPPATASPPATGMEGDGATEETGTEGSQVPGVTTTPQDPAPATPPATTP